MTSTDEQRQPLIGATALPPFSGLALHYDFEQTYLDGPLLIQRHCRIQVYRPDRRVALEGTTTVIVCSPLEAAFGSEHVDAISTTVWHLLGRPTELTWIMQWWAELVKDYPPGEEYLIQPEFECMQFCRGADGTLTSPAFIQFSRSEVEALVGPLPMLRLSLHGEPRRIFIPPVFSDEA